MEDRCISCNSIVPEGRMVCIRCDTKSLNSDEQQNLEYCIKKEDLTLRPVKLKDVLTDLVKDIITKNNEFPELYLKDGDRRFHHINEIDLFSNKICCEDGYWDAYEWVLDSEENDKKGFRLYKTQNKNTISFT